MRSVHYLRECRRVLFLSLFDILYPAKPAAAFAHPPPRAFERDRVAFRRQPDAQRPTAFDGMGVDARNLVGRCDQSFAQGKARRIIFKVGGCGHHYGIADAADLDRTRRSIRTVAAMGKAACWE